ncbi:MAG: hypothetical protein WAW37_04835 [Syntrophobacteraceae bacterium]
MAEDNLKTKGMIKFVVWGALATALMWYAIHSYTSGQMISWYYYKAASDGYAIDSAAFKTATKEKPALLEIGSFTALNGLQAVKVKKGDRLPEHTDGIISEKDIKEGKRAMIEGAALKVMVPTQIKEAKGFKYKDSYKHKGVQTNPWSGVWNVAVVLGLGICLGLMAEGFTDMLGIKLQKIKHYEGAH